MYSRTISLLCTLIVLLGMTPIQLSYAGSQSDMKEIEAALAELEPKIGVFPPNIASDEERKEVATQYIALEKKLGAAIKANPGNTDLLLWSGRLHVMGHNLDIPGAWKKAETDLLEVIHRQPHREEALVQLGSHYVNTSPDLAPRAEKLFLEAQRVHGSEPLLPAHRGLIFAYYYQGKMREALAEAETTLKLAPEDKALSRLKEIVESKIKER